MKFKSLRIIRTESYQTPANTLQGTVDMIDEGGAALTVVLSPNTLIGIFDLIAADVDRKARDSASRAADGISTAASELLLAAHPLVSVEDESPL